MDVYIIYTSYVYIYISVCVYIFSRFNLQSLQIGQVAKYLDVASCQLITSSGDAFDDAQLLEAKSDESRQRLTAVVSTEA